MAAERMKSACAAAQAKLAVAFVASRTAGLTEKEIKDERVHRSIAAQVALARRDSPFRGGRHVGLAKALVREMPNTYAALRAGEISEWRATLLVRETACLSVGDRQQVDAELAGKLGGMGDRQTAAAAMRIAQKLDPKAWVARHRKAVSERRVSIRPAPDTMGYVSALLPVAKAVAVYAALNQCANTATAVGDDRSRGQLMADEFVNRITNPQATEATTPAAGGTSDASAASECRTRQTSNTQAEVPETEDVSTEDAENPDDATDTAAGGSVPPGVGIDIQLVMTDRTLFDGDDEPAIITGYGPIPAPIARDLIRNANPDTKTWIRRLYTDPDNRAPDQRRLPKTKARLPLGLRNPTKPMSGRPVICHAVYDAGAVWGRPVRSSLRDDPGVAVADAVHDEQDPQRARSSPRWQCPVPVTRSPCGSRRPRRRRRPAT